MLTALLIGGVGFGDTSLSLVRGLFSFGLASLGARIGEISREEKSDSSFVSVRSASSWSLLVLV